MNLFSQNSDEIRHPDSRPVPQDILDAVSIMKKSPSIAGVVPQKAVTPIGGSPFLEKSSAVDGGQELKEKSAEPSFLASKSVFSRYVTNLDRQKVLYGVVGGLAGLLFLGGGLAWYFLRTEKQVPVVPAGMENSGLVPTTRPVLEPPYAPDTANYLSIDTETVTVESFSQMVQQAGTRILSVPMVRPVEFLLTDKNNNPIAFSRFAYLMKLDFSEEFLGVFGEPFSLFLFNDSGKIRLGLNLTFSDPVAAKKLIAQNEKSLPFLFHSVLFSGSMVPKEAVFRSGVYGAEAVRFVNIDGVQNISFDFVVRESGLFIGTSKETLRAILDKRR